MKLTGFVRRNSKALFTIVILLCVLGGYFAVHLPVAIFPQLTTARIAIAGDVGDIPIQTTLAQLTRPLETSISAVPGVSRVRSTTSRGSVEIDVTFVEDAEMQLALQRIQSLNAQVQANLPQGASVTAAVLNPAIFPILGYSLTSNRLDLVTLRQLALHTLRPRLTRLPGVAQVRVTGGNVPEFLVSVRPLSLQACGLTMQDVVDALAKANSIASVTQFDRSYQRYEVLVSGLLQSPEDIRQVAIAVRNRVPVFISDVAEVRTSIQKPTILATGNGKQGVLLNVVRQPEANTVQVAEEVRAALKELKPSLPAGISMDSFYDQSEIVVQSETSVIESIVVGGVLALVVLILFLGNIRVASVVLLQLPLALLITFSLMRLLGQTLNIMTLGALAIAMGMVIDDSIVVVENVYHELEKGLPRRDAVAAGMQAITPALVGSSLTTMVTFIPLTLIGGVTGQFFAPLALVMIATLLVSLTLALLFTPLIAGCILPRKVVHHGARQRRRSIKHGAAAIFGFFPSKFDWVATLFARVLLVCMRHRAVVLLLSVGALVGGALLYTRLATGFFPEFDEGAFVIDYLMPAGTSLSQTDRVCRDVEETLGKTPEVAAWSRLTGARSGSGLELTEQNQGDILVRLKNGRKRPADEIMDDIRKDLGATHPELQVDMAQMLQDGIGDIAGNPSPIEVKIFGTDTATLIALARKAGKIVSATPGVVDENDGIVESGPELVVKVNNRGAAQAGLTTEGIINAATSALRGAVATAVQQGETSIGVRVQASTAHAFGSDPITAIPDLPIAIPGSSPAPLHAVADIAVVPGTPQITREDQQQMAAVTSRLEGRDLGGAVKDVRDRLLKQLPLPPGYRIEYGGLYASQQESFAQLTTVLLITVLLVTTMLLIQLREFGQTFALFAAAILSLSGVLLGLYLTHTPLNLSSFTGAIMVVGIVTEDGIVFFEVVNRLRRARAERSVIETVMEARRLRLRPILMTILAAILALFPLALGIGAGAAMQKPLAIAVISGLIASTAFTLLVAPTIYISLEEIAARWNKRRLEDEDPAENEL